MKILSLIKLGDMVEGLISLITFGNGDSIAMWVAMNIFGKEDCGCCERKQWLNRLTNKNYNGNCNEVRLW